MLETHGDFKTVETVLKKWRIKMKKLIKSGGWYSKVYLEHEAKWTKPNPQDNELCELSSSNNVIDWVQILPLVSVVDTHRYHYRTPWKIDSATHADHACHICMCNIYIYIWYPMHV